MATLVQQQKILARLANKATFDAVIAEAGRPSGGTDKAEIIRLNQDQLREGENNEGNLIGRYAEATEYWARYGTPPIAPKYKDDPYNFEWTGDFFEAFKVKVSQTKGELFEITSNVPYLKDIQKLGTRNRAQGKIFGLNPKNKRKYIQKEVLPDILKVIKSKLV